MIFGFILGITGILNRNWFYDFEGTGLVPGADFPLTFIVELILVVVLFYGGLSIDIKKLEGVLLPGTLLATVGAFLVTLIIAIVISSIFPLVFGGITALIIGALLAPNDPIAVFSAQDSFKMNPKADTIAKFESGLDDTMVTTLVILICIPIAIQMESNPHTPLNSIIWSGVFQFFWLTISAIAIGCFVGWVFGGLYKKVRSRALKMSIHIVIPFLIFTFTNFCWPGTSMPISSGFVAVFIAGLVFGRIILKEKEEYELVNKTWKACFMACEVFTFIVLGALVRPEIFLSVLGPAITIVITILCLTRPIELISCTTITDLKFHEKLFVGYIGLKGLDPAVLAIASFNALAALTTPLVNGIDLIINLTFTVILLITLIQSIILAILFSKKGYYARKFAKQHEFHTSLQPPKEKFNRIT